MNTAAVILWGTRIGAVSWDAERQLGFFQYDPAFLPSGIQPAPLTMPLSEEIFAFPALGRRSFRGLPGLLSDSLPDRFGNALIDAWLASRGRTPESFDPVERLAYTGRRGLGALEFEPAVGERATDSERLDVGALVDLAATALTDRERFVARLGRDADARAVRDLLRVGTSAGGARAKAVIAWNPETGEVRSGQVETGGGFSHWILKLDGVRGDREHEDEVSPGFGRIEYAYHLMARAAGIEMFESRLLEENGRAHFVTRRFDRTSGGGKLHMQSLCAVAHLDYHLAGAHSWEQCLQVTRRLGLGTAAVEEQYRRAVFNVLARNQDDHTKNLAFLMDKSGSWTLAPAFDLTWAYNPEGPWTSQHQMSLNGKRGAFELADFEALARAGSLKRGRYRGVFDEVRSAVARWGEFAARAAVPGAMVRAIEATLRVDRIA